MWIWGEQIQPIRMLIPNIYLISSTFLVNLFKMANKNHSSWSYYILLNEYEYVLGIIFWFQMMLYIQSKNFWSLWWNEGERNVGRKDPSSQREVGNWRSVPGVVYYWGHVIWYCSNVLTSSQHKTLQWNRRCFPLMPQMKALYPSFFSLPFKTWFPERIWLSFTVI